MPETRKSAQSGQQEKATNERGLRRDLPSIQAIVSVLQEGGHLALSVSGGKDSQVLVRRVLAEPALSPFKERMFVIHADLGRAEWSETPAHVEIIAEEAGLPLVIVRREGGDLYERFEQRERKLEGTGKPHWPSAAARYCTSDLKRGPINKYLRRYDRVISVEGIRAQESSARAKKDALVVRKAITTKRLKESTADEAIARHLEKNDKGRLGLTWRPILDFTLEDVWYWLGTSKNDVARRRMLYSEGKTEAALDGWGAHIAYVRGNRRLSCAFCILAGERDLRNAARHEPEKLHYLAEMERRTGFTFKQDFSLAELEEEIKNGKAVDSGVGEELSLF